MPVQDRDGDGDAAEPLPIDGMDVEEFRDTVTARLFMLEWRRRTRIRSGHHPVTHGRGPRPGGMIGA
jgi:hypothetical protein